MIRLARAILSALALAICIQALAATWPAHGNVASPVGAVRSPAFHTAYVRLGSEADEGLLYEPTSPGPKARVALLFSHPDGNNFDYPVGSQMAARGYRILMVNHHGVDHGLWTYAPGISQGIRQVRTLPG